MKIVSNILIVFGFVCLGYFGYQYFSMEQAQNEALVQAQEKIDEWSSTNPIVLEDGKIEFEAEHMEAFGKLEIPKLGKTIGIVEGADEDALAHGVGHMSQTAFPGQEEQIVLSGHRDTVFRGFGDIEIGDQFVVHMPYGTYTYEIKETEIVTADDTSVVRKAGKEELVVSTCYPFEYIGSAPDRFVTYAQLVDIDEK